MSRSIQFLLSSVPSNLAAAIDGKASATVEAEYGDNCVEGSVLTMAHHGPRAGQPAPCSYSNEVGEGVEVAGLSHFDLDTLGGCMALLGNKPEVKGFWELAEFVDLNGAHKLSQSGASEENLRCLHAFWAWSQSFRVFPPRDGSVADVTDKVTTGIEVLTQILADDEKLLEAGDAFKASQDELNITSYVEAKGSVVARSAASFTNHLYADPDGNPQDAVVSFNTKTGAVTVSFADPPQGVTAREIVQTVFQDKDEEGNFLAGGHAGIAGSPRNRRATLAEFAQAVEVAIAVLAGN